MLSRRDVGFALLLGRALAVSLLGLQVHAAQHGRPTNSFSFFDSKADSGVAQAGNKSQ